MVCIQQALLFRVIHVHSHVLKVLYRGVAEMNCAVNLRDCNKHITLPTIISHVNSTAKGVFTLDVLWNAHQMEANQ